MGKPSGKPVPKAVIPKDLEDETQRRNRSYRTDKKVNEVTLPPRLGYIQSPNLDLFTNCFHPIQVNRDVNIFYYGVKATRTPSSEELAAKAKRLKLQEAEGKEPNPNSSGKESDKDSSEAQGTKLGHILYHLFETNDYLKDLISQGKLASDFRNILVTTEELKEDKMSFTIYYKGEKSRYRTDEYLITISEPADGNNKYAMEDLLKYIEGSDHMTADGNNANKEQIIQALNLFLRHRSKTESLHPYQHPPGPSPTQAVVGSKAYDIRNPQTFRDLTEGAVMTPGCFSSIRPAAGRLLINVNMTFGPFYKSGLLKDFVYEIPADKRNALLKGLRVRLTHRNGEMNTETPNRAIRVIKAINDFIDKDWNELSFTITEGTKESKTMTVREYFKKNYPDMTSSLDALRDRKIAQKLVNVGTDERPVYVPIAFCEVLAGQSYRAVLTGQQTAKMIESARQKPQVLMENLLKVGPQLTGLKAQHVNGTKLITEFDLLQVKGKRLPDVAVRFGKDSKDRYQDPKKEGKPAWNLIVDFKYANPRPLDKWSMLYVQEGGKPDESSTTLGRDTLRDKAIIRFANAAGSRSKLILHHKDLKSAVYKNILTHCKRERDKLVLVFLPSKLSAADYRRLKRISDSEVGILTQFVDSKKAAIEKVDPRFPKALEQYCDNVLLKINLKLGGDNQIVTSMPDPGLINFAETMVVGLDVTHPIPGSGEVPNSTAGMVASVDKNLGQWPGMVYIQAKPGTEVVQDNPGIPALLEPHLKRWKRNHGKYPTNILVYRDGVSEGQYKDVLQKEFRQMKQVCQRLYSSNEDGPMIQPDPKITIVIVGKRHHIRFYIKDAKGMINNPQPGTLVDRGVTSQFLWEFYLQAHLPLAGVARPAHYVVVADEIFRDLSSADIEKAKIRAMKSPSAAVSGTHKDMKTPSDVLYAVTHALSYAVGRSTTATGVCAPAFWADKLCDRAKWFNPSPGAPQDSSLKLHPDLEDTMFYV